MELINAVALKTFSKKWTLRFYTGSEVTEDAKIVEQTIEPWKYNTNPTYDFTGFGRNIVLDICGNTLQFNTMKAMTSYDITRITAKADLSFSCNGSFLAKASIPLLKEPTTCNMEIPPEDVEIKRHQFDAYPISVKDLLGNNE